MLRETCGILSIAFKNTILSTGIVRYKPLRETSFLPTPKELKNCLALVNVNSNDKKMFSDVNIHCVKSVPTRSFSGPYFTTFRLNME